MHTYWQQGFQQIVVWNSHITVIPCTVAALKSCRSRDLILVHCALRMRFAIRFDSVQPWIGRSEENRFASSGQFFTFQNLKLNMSRRPSTENTANWGKMIAESSKMGKRWRNESLTGIMGRDKTTTTMGAYVLLHLAFLVLEPNLHSRGIERCGKDLSILWSRKIFHIPAFKCTGGGGEVKFDELLELIRATWL